MASMPIGDNFARVRLLQAMKAGYIDPQHVPPLDAPPGAALAAYQGIVPFLHQQARQGYHLGIPGLLRAGMLNSNGKPPRFIPDPNNPGHSNPVGPYEPAPPDPGGTNGGWPAGWGNDPGGAPPYGPINPDYPEGRGGSNNMLPMLLPTMLMRR